MYKNSRGTVYIELSKFLLTRFNLGVLLKFDGLKKVNPVNCKVTGFSIYLCKLTEKWSGIICVWESFPS